MRICWQGILIQRESSINIIGDPDFRCRAIHAEKYSGLNAKGYGTIHSDTHFSLNHFIVSSEMPLQFAISFDSRKECTELDLPLQIAFDITGSPIFDKLGRAGDF